MNKRLELLKKLNNEAVDITVDGFGDFKVKGMSTGDYLYAASYIGGENTANQDNYFAALIVRCVMDTDGHRIFNDEDLEVVAQADAGFVLPLALKVQTLSGNLNSEEDAKKD